MSKRKIIKFDDSAWGEGRSEKDNQKYFWNAILGHGEYDKVIQKGTDGLFRNVLFEFKKGFSRSRYTKGMALDEAIGYLSKFNNNVIDIPPYVVVSSFDTKEFFVYQSKDFVECIYDSFYWKRKSNLKELKDRNDEPIYKGYWNQPNDLIRSLNKYFDKKAIPFKVNLDNFHKLNDKFYNILDVKYENEKDDFYKKKEYHAPKFFIREIKNPKVLNLVPNTIHDIKEIVAAKWDHVGGSESIKTRGAFFTPDQYVKISTQYLKEAIPKNLPYLIIDRCAGSGNLEKFLDSEQRKHCLLNTYEYCEWIYLASKYDEWGEVPKVENVGKKCQVIPPFNKQSLNSIYFDKDQGNGDALSQEFNEWLKSFINLWREKNEGGIVIFLENPPFADIYSNKKGGIKSSMGKTSWIYKQMNKVPEKQQLENQFIWSAFNLFLTEKDSYILYAPISYWKSHHIINKQFVKGYICNRRYFTDNKGDCALPLIWWKNKENCNKKICLVTASITNTGKYGSKKCTIENLWYKSPLFCAGRNKFAESGNRFYTDNDKQDYTAINTIFKSADGGKKYIEDANFLRSCFIYTCLTNLQQCISDDKVRNELALLQNTKADAVLYKHKQELAKGDIEILNSWKELIEEAKQCQNKEAYFDKKLTYGLYQIEKDLCSAVIEKEDKFGKKYYEDAYKTLNDKVFEFKKELEKYYKKNIHSKLFKYELLK